MLTLFACPKAFEDHHVGVIQTNAITSWAHLHPEIEILLIGDEPGIAEISKQVGATHIGSVRQTDLGTPDMADAFERAQQAANSAVLCYVNADIILMQDFTLAVARVRHHPLFLMSGSRINIDQTTYLDFDDPMWERNLRKKAQKEGRFSYWGNDYFAFSAGLYGPIPPLAIGRGHFDAWLFWEAARRGARIIDATSVVTSVHQAHDYAHIPDGSDPWTSREGMRNLAVTGNNRYWYIASATHDLTPTKEKRVRGRKLYKWLEDTRVAHLFLYRLGSIRHRLGIRRRSFLGSKRHSGR